MKIRINPLTPVMLIAVTIAGNLKLYLLAYLVMALHETAHLIASLCIGLKPERVTFSPFGVHLQLRCKMINSVADEVILYSAGPLVNAVFALLSLALKMPVFYRLNIALFVMNILPVSPLDGGMVALRLLSFRVGRKYAQRILVSFSVVLGVILLVLACYGLYIGYINVSLFVIAILFIGNILTSRQMYDTDLINAVSVDKKRTNKAKFVIINSQHKKEEILKNLSPDYTTVALIIDEKNKISGLITEKELIENIDLF